MRQPERGIMGSVIIRPADHAEFFATRAAARRLIRERVDCFPEREAVIFDWSGVAAVTGAFASEFAAWFIATGRRVGNQGMNEDVRATYETAARRLASHPDHTRPASAPFENGPALTASDEGAPRCPKCCVHGLPYSAEDQKRYGTTGWCGWCEDAAGGYDDGPGPQDPQWLCPHGIGVEPGGH